METALNSTYGHLNSTSRPRGAYGQVDISAELLPPDTSEGPGIWDLAVGYMPVAQAFAATLQDKYKLMVNAERKLLDAKAAGHSLAYVGRLEANYLAAKRAYDKQREGEESTRQYRLLGQIAAATGIGIGVVTIFFILTRAMR